MERVDSLYTGEKFKKTEIGYIPVDWEIKTLITAVGVNNNLIVAGPFGSNLKVKDYRDTGVPIVRLQNIKYCKFFNKDIKYISIKKADELNYHSFEKGDIVLAKLGDPIGKTCIIPESLEKGIVVADVVRIRIDEQFSDKIFIMYVLNSFYGKRQLNREIIGTTRPRVNLNQVRNIVIPYPPLAEQKKIAEILSAIDEAIEKKSQIIEKTKELKKFLMQKLLTKGIGHREFKKTEIGEIPVTWVIVTIDHICTVVGGSKPSTKNDEYWNGDILWAIPSDITNLKGNVISKTEKMITPKGLATCAARILPEGSILLTSRATIGECAINTKLMATNQGFTSLICKKDIHNWFIFYTMIFIRKDLERLGSGSTFKEVSKKSIRSFKIPLPLLHEQKKIADILSSLDNEIENEIANKEKLIQIKKGLMQVLLTGKIRVKV